MSCIMSTTTMSARPVIQAKSFSSKVASGKSAMHGARVAPRAVTIARGHRKTFAAHATSSNSGFLLDMSDLISSGSSVKIMTEKECALGLSFYPDFAYNAEGGGGYGRVTAMDIDGKVAVSFDPLTLSIPALESSTADLMGLPLPPLFKGEIKPISLSGFIEKRSGKVDMQFDAEIVPSVTTLMQGTPLKLFMNLTTETSWGATRSARGKRLDSEGRCVLVGVARLPPSSDPITSTLLMLPTDALAVLQVRFEFTKF